MRRGTGSARRPDRRAVGAPGGRRRAPPGPDPRLRRPRGLGHRVPHLRRLAELAGGAGPGAAGERVRVARALGTLPLLAQALARGELSYAKVRALTRVATPETEARLLGVGRGGTAAQVERIVRGWRRVDRQAEAKESARQHASRALHVYEDEDGTVVLRGRLAPEVGALLRRALAAARETLYQQTRREETATSPTDPSADTPTRAQQQADALALLAETALHQ